MSQGSPRVRGSPKFDSSMESVRGSTCSRRRPDHGHALLDAKTPPLRRPFKVIAGPLKHCCLRTLAEPACDVSDVLGCANIVRFEVREPGVGVVADIAKDVFPGDSQEAHPA